MCYHDNVLLCVITGRSCDPNLLMQPSQPSQQSCACLNVQLKKKSWHLVPVTLLTSLAWNVHTYSDQEPQRPSFGDMDPSYMESSV